MTSVSKKRARKVSSLEITLALMIVCLFAGLLLGLAYTFTKEPIENKKLSVNQAAYQKVLSEGAELLPLSLSFNKEAYPNILEVYENQKDQEYAVKVVGKGYAGDDIELAVGLSKEGTILGIDVIAHSETPGLGAKATEESFRSLFVGKKAGAELSVSKTGAISDTQIDAITGATRTTDGIVRAVNEVFAFYTEYLAKGGN